MSDKEHPRIAGLRSLPLAASAPGSFVRACHDYLLASFEGRPPKDVEALKAKALKSVQDAIADKTIDMTADARPAEAMFVDVLHSVAEMAELPFPGEKKVAGATHAERARPGKGTPEKTGNTDYKAAGIAWLIAAKSDRTPREVAGLKKRFRNALERAIVQDEGKLPEKADLDQRAATVIAQIAKDIGAPVPGQRVRE